MEDKLQNALTGTASTLVGLPFDVVTLRLQTGAGSPKGVLATLHGLARKEGLRSLGKGGVPALTNMGLNRLCNSGEDVLSDSYSVKTESALQCLATTASTIASAAKW